MKKRIKADYCVLVYYQQMASFWNTALIFIEHGEFIVTGVIAAKP